MRLLRQTGAFQKVSLILFGSLISFGQSPYVKQRSIGSPKPQTRSESVTRQSAVPIEQWRGRQIIFLNRPKPLQSYGYHSFSGENGGFGTPTYEELVGKVGTVVEIQLGSSRGVVVQVAKSDKRYVGSLENGVLRGIAFLDELDDAKSALVGKTLWTYFKELGTYDADKEEFGSVPVRRLSPVKVTDVVAGWTNDRPVRLILQAQNGTEGFSDVSFDGTNSSEARYRFENQFFSSNPKNAFQWTERVWKAIESEKVFVGMTKAQATMSWGKPETVNRTIGTQGTSEQWIYPDGTYLYFSGNLLTTVQD